VHPGETNILCMGKRGLASRDKTPRIQYDTAFSRKTYRKDIHKPNQPPYWVVVEEEVQEYVRATYQCGKGEYNKAVIRRQKVQRR